MALAIANLKRLSFGNVKGAIADITFDSSYPTGGESLTAAMLGLNVINAIIANPTGIYLPQYDYSNKKLKAYGGVVSAEKDTYSVSDLKGSANTDSANADQAAAPTNGTAVAAAAAVAAGAWTHGAITNPDIARNVCITILNDSGDALNLYEGAMKFTVTGTFNGVAQTEDITLTSTAGNKAVANSKYRYVYGSKPFTTVTNIVVDHVPDDGIKIAAGLGSKLGLPNTLKTPVEADVISISKNAAYLAVTGLVDTTNNTLNAGALTDGDDIEVVYEFASHTSHTVEVANTANLSTVTTKVVAYGW